MRASPTKKYASKKYRKRVKHIQKFPNKLARKAYRSMWAGGAYTAAIKGYFWTKNRKEMGL